MFKSLQQNLLLGFALFLIVLSTQPLQAQDMTANWWYDAPNDSVAGIDTRGMAAYLQQRRLTPLRTPRIAIIDGGFNLQHPALTGVVKGEDGWNFLGNAEGKHIERTGTEAFREFKRLYPKYKGVKTASEVAPRDTAEYQWYRQMAREINIEMYLIMAQNQELTYRSMAVCDSLMRLQYGERTTTLGDFHRIEVADTTGLTPHFEIAMNYLVRYDEKTPWRDIVQTAKADYELSHKRVKSLENTNDDPHELLGNHPNDFGNLHYGNSDTHLDAYHGTMVAGLVAEMLRQAGVQGTIIPIRAIPDGDEYDRDVAAAIRWAVDHGAQVVNMSFGKYHSPHAKEVQEAIAYAQAHDVVLLRASGNYGKSLDQRPLYPLPYAQDIAQRWDHMLVIGASDRDGRRAKMSSYGRVVDLLAPGMRITSTKDDGTYDTQDGTSLATPIVSGLVAVLRAYYPDLKTSALIRIIRESQTNGVVNALKAVQLADAESRHGEGLFRQAEYMTSDSIYHLIHNTQVEYKWLGKRHNHVYYSRVEKGAEHPTHYIYSIKAGREQRLFDNDELYRLLKPYDEKNRLKEGNRIYLSDLRLSGDEKSLLIPRWDKVIAYNLRTRQASETTEEMKRENDWTRARGDYRRSYSSDSLYYMTAIGHQLWLHDVRRGDSIPLTTDGEHYFSYAIGGNSEREQIEEAGQYSPLGDWIGCTHRYLVVREDKRAVLTLSIVNSLGKGRPTTKTYKFSMPGDTAVSQFHTAVFNAETRKLERVIAPAYPDQLVDMPRFGRLAQCEKAVYLLEKSRYQDSLTLLRVNGVTGEVKTLIQEEVPPHLNEQLFNFKVLNEGKDILWWSERHGKGQYFLYDGEGRLRHAITPADMVAGQIVHIDTVGRQLYFEGYGREHKTYDAAYKYYYKVGMDGKGLRCLTPKAGEHEVKFAPDYRTLVDRCSRMDALPEYTLYDLQGRALHTLAKADASEAEARGWRMPRVVQVTAADGKTPLWGIVYTPWWMGQDDKLPLISNPYPGPHTDLLPRGYEFNDNGNQTLADLGFIVINFSYRGSNPYRGKAYYTHGYGNLRDYALDDDKATLRQVAQLIPQADTTRIGIYGHSGGAFMATAALLTSPHFYKVAVAASGNHDNNIYLKWWGETFHGRGQIPTTLSLADRLQGRLLLMHGDRDDNVHPASTLRMADALIRAGKQFDMLIIPGVDHGVGGSYYENKIRYYMLEHLAGKAFPHIDILQHK